VAKIIEATRFDDPVFGDEAWKLVGCEVHVFYQEGRSTRAAHLFCDCDNTDYVESWNKRGRARWTLRGWLLGGEDTNWAVDLIESLATKEAP
jgi:hypothetical protein